MALPAPEAAASAWWIPGLSAVLGSVVGSLGTGIFTLWATNKQQKAQTHREYTLMRLRSHDQWRDKFTEYIPNIINTAGWFYVSKMKGSNTEWNNEKTSQTLKLVQQIAQVKLMLDINDRTHVSVIEAINNVRDCAFADGQKLNEFEHAVEVLTVNCLALLKNEVAKTNGGER